ncbi:hypothetical protein GCM10020220_093100 [Nonomuraea rubra]|uniref:hypothetical protein n=1 Tax=Nonomuraea rubra TaxID=46180 RepID=UPI0031EE4EE8
MDANLTGVYLPPGDYQTNGKFQVYGKPVKVVGRAPWFTSVHAPSGQSNTDIGFRSEATANGSAFSGFAYFATDVERIDGPGKVFDFNNCGDHDDRERLDRAPDLHVVGLERRQPDDQELADPQRCSPTA